MIITAATLSVVLFAVLGEWLHGRRSRRVTRLAFGPTGQPARWTKVVPLLRVISLGSLAWGLTTLLEVEPKSARGEMFPEGGYRHLIIALDVSPSMQLKDSGPQRNQSRASRAGDVTMSLLQRIAIEQVRISIVGFYTDAKPVAVDTFDMDVVANVLNDLPISVAFEPGKTRMIEGVRAAAEIAKPWQPDSTTLVVVSDGDTLPDSGMPPLPRSVSQVIVVGVGDARTGLYIDGHQSRQNAATLRQLAGRLRGEYFDANEKHLPSKSLTALSDSLPLRDQTDKGRRELALVAVVMGGILLAGLPVALASAGAPWQSARHSGIRKRTTRRNRGDVSAGDAQKERTRYA